MKKYFDTLLACPLFSQIGGEDLSGLLGCLGARVQKYSKRDIIMREGDSAQDIGIVLSGSVQIVRVDYFGNRSILSVIGKAQLFAESFACAGLKEIPVDAIANEDCEIMLINCQKILHSCSNACDFHRQMIFNLMKIAALKNIMFHQKIEVTSKRTTREKLMTYLLLRAKQTGSRSFEIPFDRQELADYLGVDRSGLSAEISRLRREGVLKSRKNRFELL